MLGRYSKIMLLWAIALFASSVVFNNVTDYATNYEFVAHVLKMDTTFSDNNGRWRSINTPFWHHAVYRVIIATEFAVAVLCWWGGWRLVNVIDDANRFNANKGVAVLGLTLGLLLWFTGFITIGGEWFLMWQSKIWNGQQAAFRICVIIGIILVYISLPEQ